MDEAAGTERSTVTSSQAVGADEARSPEEIKADIATTRQEVGDTVEALAEKTDVKAQTRQRVDEVKSNVRAKVGQLQSSAQNMTPERAQQGGRQVLDRAKANPAALAVGGALLLGVLVGRRTRRP